MDSSEKREQVIRRIKSLFAEKEDEDVDLTEQRDKLTKFLQTDRAYYLLLLPVLALAWYVRTRNIPNLGGKYLMGLDPYAFFRYAQEIVQTGTMATHDMMRYVPWGYDLRMDYKFLSYILAYSYKIVHAVFPSVSQIEWHIIYPPIATITSLVFFFLFVRNMFGSRVGLLATAFLAVIPGYIYRTGAGFADHEALAMMFMFAGFWLFSLMWKSKARLKSILFGACAGLMTACMYFTWPGGYRFLVISLAGLGILSTLFIKTSKSQFIGYLSWAGAFILFSAAGLGSISFISELENLLLGFAVAVVLANHIKPIRNFADNLSRLLPYKIPAELLIIAGVAVIGFFAGWITGLIDPSFLIGRILHPGGTSRFAFTVSENQQPYFIGGNGWWGGFSWTFLLAFFGSIYLVMKMFKSFRVGLAVAGSYTLFMLIFIFGRFSPSSKYDKIAAFSSATYLFWFALFVGVVLWYYIYYYNKNTDFSEVFDAKWSYLLVFVWFLLTAIIARGAVRTIFAFAPAVAVVAGFFAVNIVQDLFKREYIEKLLAVILVLFTIFCLYSNIGQAYHINISSGSGLPGQWENAMVWIRDNTPEDAVIAHWWDYGYWTQAVGERATVVDGGNAMQWDHGMGRYGLTHNNLQETFDYFKTHKVTHLLISDEEIPKYHAFATIGSDENFDRRSTIGIFGLKEQKELRDGMQYIYQGGWGLDQDIVADKMVIPEGTGMGAISVTINNDGSVEAPVVYLYPDGQQFAMNVDCLVYNGVRYEFQVAEPKIEGCVVLLPYYTDAQTANPIGAAFFLSSKVRDGNLARLYLYGEEIPGFKLVFDDGNPLAVYQGSIIGPIKIWEIEYPSSAKTDDKYLEKSIYG